VRERLVNAGAEVLPGPVDRLTTLPAGERVRYRRLIREARIEPDQAAPSSTRARLGPVGLETRHGRAGGTISAAHEQPARTPAAITA